MPDTLRYSNVFRSGALFGAGEIIKAYLGLPTDHVLALTVPHGVDTHLLRLDLDVHSYEPLYLALRPDIAERVAAYKKPLLFPHPWLLMREMVPQEAAQGSLFIGPPPDEESFERMYRAMGDGSFPRPWGILLKNRGLEAQDFDWWRSRGVQVHSAGTIREEDFYYKLREIIAGYEVIASPNMSSAVVFAAAMGKVAMPLPNVEMSLIETGDIDLQQDFADRDGRARRVWRELLSGDPERSRPQALTLLGADYLAPPDELRTRYLEALSAAGKRVHLHPLRSGPLLSLFDWLIRRGLPVHKLFPNPFARIRERVGVTMKRNWLTVIEGSDLSHYRVSGDCGPYRIRRVRSAELSGGPGFAVRNAKSVAAAGIETPQGRDLKSREASAD